MYPVLSYVYRYAIAAAVMALMAGCITVPPEVVTLSQISKEDTKKLQDGYRSLVRKHFAALRELREQHFAEKVLGPYVEDAITEGRVFDVLAGKVVWNGATEAFDAPDPKRASMQKLDTLNTWYRQVASDIEDLRKSAFADLDSLEKNVLDDVDAAFGRVISADAAIYAYLVSIQKVEAAQRDALKQFELEDLPDKINKALDDASQKAAKWTENMKDAEGKTSVIKKKVKRIKEKK